MALVAIADTPAEPAAASAGAATAPALPVLARPADLPAEAGAPPALFDMPFDMPVVAAPLPLLDALVAEGDRALGVTGESEHDALQNVSPNIVASQVGPVAGMFIDLCSVPEW